MKRSLPNRVSALLWAVAFLLMTAGEGFGLSPCPYHDSLHDSAGHHDHAGHGAADPAGSDHPPGHHHDATDASADGTSASGHAPGGHAENEPCTHVEACQTASGVVAPDVSGSLSLITFATEVASTHPPVERLSTGYPPHFLPFSNAPPAHG